MGRTFKRVQGDGVLRLSDGTERPVRYGLTVFEPAVEGEPMAEECLQGHVEADPPGFQALSDSAATLQLADGRRLEILLQRSGDPTLGDRELPFTVRG